MPQHTIEVGYYEARASGIKSWEQVYPVPHNDRNKAAHQVYDDGFADAYFGGCSFFGADIEGTVPNVVIDFDDVLGALDAFSGAAYLDNPSHIDPCP